MSASEDPSKDTMDILRKAQQDENRVERETEEVTEEEEELRKEEKQQRELEEQTNENEEHGGDPQDTEYNIRKEIQLQIDEVKLAEDIIQNVKEEVGYTEDELKALSEGEKGAYSEFRTAKKNLQYALNDLTQARKSDDKHVTREDWKALEEGIEEFQQAAEDLHELTEHWFNLVGEYYSIVNDENRLEEEVRELTDESDMIEKEIKVGDEEAREWGDRQTDEELHEDMEEEQKVEGKIETEIKQVEAIKEEIEEERQRFSKRLNRHYDDCQKLMEQGSELLGDIYEELDRLKTGKDRNGGRISRARGKMSNRGKVSRYKKSCKKTANQIEKLMKQDEKRTQNAVKKLKKKKVKSTAKKGVKWTIIFVGLVLAGAIGFALFLM